MLINLSNHPSSKWNSEQTEAAQRYGEIVDLPFPAVAPDGDEAYLSALVEDYAQRVAGMANGEPVTVHLMGEMTFTCAMVVRLREMGIECVAATTERIVEENEAGQKTTTFSFVQFRRYLSK